MNLKETIHNKYLRVLSISCAERNVARTINKELKKSVLELIEIEKMILDSLIKLGNKREIENQNLRLARIKDIFGDFEQ